MQRFFLMMGKSARLGLLGMATLAVVGLWGCSSTPTGYDDPAASITTTQTATALIDAVTLKQWIDEGKLNSTVPGTRDRIVVLTVSPASNYNSNHIPGSLLWNFSTEAFMTRLEGVAPIASMVPDGPAMDALLQRFGIDRHTTIVLTTSTGLDLRNATRAYFTLRYWGFPKERLKVLQGADPGWVAAGYALTTQVPTVKATTFSVRDLYRGSTSNFDNRSSIGEMISTVDRINAGTLPGVKVLDERGGINPAVGPYMAVAGLDSWDAYYVTGSTTTLKPTADLIARLATFGVTSTTPMTYTSCQTGVKCSVAYFILDGILGWPGKVYDGSNSQWTGYVTANNVGSIWRVDTNSPGTTLGRTFGTITPAALTLDPAANAMYTSLTDRRANQILVEDRSYFTSGGSTVSGGGSPGGTGGPSGC